MKVLTREEILPYIEKGLISEQIHPEDSNVRIYNYTHECQWTKQWDDITMQCRGLIMNIATGEVLARPFTKFFNYDEWIAMGKSIPNELPVIREKLDGSLGIMYTLNGKTHIATRGSFTSDQAQWATKWWRDNKGDEPYGNDVTHLFEIIYPANRIVVKYDFEGLVHLTSIDTKTGLELPNETMPVARAALVNTPLHLLKEFDVDNAEGFVILFPESNLRLKIKYKEYVRLHKIMTGLSEKGIWEMLREKGINSRPHELIKDVPDEFFEWFAGVVADIRLKYHRIEQESLAMVEMFTDDSMTRKEKAEILLKSATTPSICFAMLDKKDYSDAIFKMIKPKSVKAFAEDIQ